ncbi:hypothetical protein [Fodinicola feengrottensis]|uniref:hypothetical protein n=1 Tax=Fodinicola feengrottensis TaxID=435914 RepID=UPI00244316EC|nr:hypothetical protein [Fodinicola feengrottensis]
MRDVIVIGAGGGGPVVAKELAAKGGWTSCCWRPARVMPIRQGMDALRERREQPADRVPPVRPG